MQKRRSETFDEVAELYDRIRPSYPAELVEAIIDVTQLRVTARILEIGCGTGQATLPFARRGYEMLCLEPGRNLAAVAAENLRAYPNVTIENVTFEDWPLPSQAFDLVISATAFHWLADEIKYVKTAQALDDTGWIALCWNMTPDHCDTLDEAMDLAYRTHAPKIGRAPDHPSFAAQVQERADQIERSGCFRNLVVRQFPWTKTYSTRQYLDLLDTYSDHRTLPEPRKRALFEAIGEILHGHGGHIDKAYVAVLYLAQKR
ncbi:MAG TPA: methyltransferase domain-containing protein [Herpetosiphonaceae bacterium]